MSVNTSCRNCVFATWDENRKQTGCSAGRLELFQKVGATIERSTDAGAEGIEPGTEREFEVIKGRVCVLCRHENSQWAKEVHPETRLTQARTEVTPKVHAIVHCPDGTTIDDILDTATSLEQQTLPVTTHFVLTGTKPSQMLVVTSLRRKFPITSKLSWNVRVIHEHGTTKGGAVDAVVKTLSLNDCSHYLVLDAGTIVWDSIAADLDAAINDRLERFLLLTPIDQQEEGRHPLQIGPIVQTRLHLMVHGNTPGEHDLEDGTTIRVKSVEEKLGLMATDDGTTHLIKRLSEVCPPPA